jgi:uncharacterized protein
LNTLKIIGTQSIAANRVDVWEKLNDPEVLAACIDGCTRLQRISDTQFDGTVTVKIGPVKASFDGLVTLSELDPPNGYTLLGEGKGGAAGFVKGNAVIKLSDSPDGNTVLSYEANANVGGKLAQLGARLIESTARDQADKFFTKFNLQCAPAVLATETAALISEPIERKGIPAWIWGTAIAGLSLILLYLLAR